MVNNLGVYILKRRANLKTTDKFTISRFKSIAFVRALPLVLHITREGNLKKSLVSQTNLQQQSNSVAPKICELNLNLERPLNIAEI